MADELAQVAWPLRLATPLPTAFVYLTQHKFGPRNNRKGTPESLSSIALPQDMVFSPKLSVCLPSLYNSWVSCCKGISPDSARRR